MKQFKSEMEIRLEIARLEASLADVHGTPCEIYSRIVGYYRPVKEWNAGQQAQYKDRKTFSFGSEATKGVGK